MEDYTGPYGTMRDYIGPYGTMRDHMGPYRTIGGHTGPNSTVQDNSGLLHARVEKSVTDSQTHRLTHSQVRFLEGHAPLKKPY